MRKGIAAEYFSLSLSLVAASMLVIATLIIKFSATVFMGSYRQILNNGSAALRRSTVECLSGGYDAHKMDEMLVSAGTGESIQYILFSADGDVLACSETSPCSHNDKLDAPVMNSADTEGTLALTDMGGFYGEKRANMLYLLGCGGERYYLAVSTDADGYYNYMKNMVVISLVCFLAIMLVIYPILKYTVNRIMTPIKKMTLAAKRFGDGDFSEKVEVSDRNELGFLANTLNEMAYSLEATEENRKSFISNVSHELRTPMTTIGGFVDGILDGTIPKEQHRQYLKTVSEEINRLARLVRSMLNISKYEAGEMKLQTDVFDLTELTVKTVLLFEKRIENKNIDIRGLDADRFFVNADTDLVQQVIYNLTENAVKFVNEGGYIAYSFRAEGDKVAAVIRNSGEGLKKNEMTKVFDRFYKTDESRGKDKTGVGLGLSIVRSIIKLHDGSVLVRSKADEFTEFEYTLPAGETPPLYEVYDMQS